MRILHSADWHLDAPLTQLSPEQGALVKGQLLALPEKIAALVQTHQCDLVLLAGDIFDGQPSWESLDALHRAFRQMQVPVFISPGNHDFCTAQSPWLQEAWPENVHVFTKAQMESVAVPALDCRVYGAGYQSMDCDGLLAGFQAQCEERYALGVLHGNPNKSKSPYCPITTEQIRESGLDYLALGHIHQGGSFLAGQTLCAWPGCPMGKGFDETGTKGVLLVTLEETARTEFLPLDGVQFFDICADAQMDPQGALEGVLPALCTDDFYRVTLTGEAETVDVQKLQRLFPHIPNLTVADKTQPPLQLWKTHGQDTLEGIYFDLLQELAEGEDPALQRRAQLAAKISRQLLEGREVTLP